MLNRYKFILYIVGSAIIFLLAYESNQSDYSLVFGREIQSYPDMKNYENITYDPAAPSIPCDTSCHTDPKDFY